jgi:hypothetical protein
MNVEIAVCPNCGAKTDDLGEESGMCICPECKTLAWDENGKLEWRVPEKVSLEDMAAMEKEEILTSHDPAEFRKATADRTSGVLTVGCPHCGHSNTFPEFGSIDVFICDECGQPVVVDEPIQ